MVSQINNKIYTNTSQSVIISKNKSLKNNKSLVKGYVTIIVKRKNGLVETIQKMRENVLTNVGRDYLINQSYVNTSAGGRGAGFIGLTTSTLSSTVSTTSLSGEITSGGLGRVDATTKTHVTGTNSIVISNVFSATATHTNVARAGLFTASTGGILVNVDNFTNSFTLQNGDSVTVIWNISFG